MDLGIPEQIPLSVWFAISAWALLWKGIALWRSARRGHKKWFIAIVILNTAGVLEIAYLVFFSKEKKEEGNARAGAEALRAKKEEAKRDIMEFLKENGRVANDDVQNMLDVSHATAANYLSELEREGLIRQEGWGRGTYYVAKNVSSSKAAALDD